MTWWLESVTSKHFGWVRNPLTGKISDFSRFFFFRFFFVKIFSMPPENQFLADKSVEKSDFLFTGYGLPKLEAMTIVSYSGISVLVHFE